MPVLLDVEWDRGPRGGDCRLLPYPEEEYDPDECELDDLEKLPEEREDPDREELDEREEECELEL